MGIFKKRPLPLIALHFQRVDIVQITRNSGKSATGHEQQSRAHSPKDTLDLRAMQP